MIFITGCARSGTSLTTKIIEAHGVELGRNVGRGVNMLYENVDVREKVLKPYLRAIGADPTGQCPLPDTENVPPFSGLRDMVAGHIPEQEPWAYKDAKLSLIWPSWADEYPQAKWVLVRRDKEKIVESCVRTSFMRAFEDRVGWTQWVIEHEKRFAGMRAVLDLIEVWPDRFIHDPEEFRPVAEFCGLEFDRKKVERAIDRNVWH